MNWCESDLAEQMTLFKQTMNLYLDDEDITENERKARKILRGIGSEGLKRLNASALSDEDLKTTLKIWIFFEESLNTNINFRIHRLNLMRYRQNSGETIDEFMTRSRNLAKKCQFTDMELNERLIELVIASTPYESFCKDLLTKPVGYTISDLLVDGRKHEAISAGKEKLKEMSQQNISTIHTSCSRCGTKHKPKICPAYMKNCVKCGRVGHFSKMCRSSSTSAYESGHKQKIYESTYKNNKSKKKYSHSKQKPRYKSNVDEISDDVGNEKYEQLYYSITVSNKCFDAINHQRNEAFTTLRINLPNKPKGKQCLKLKIDTGASWNTLPVRTLMQMYPQQLPQLQPNKTKLTAYNGEQIKCIGKFTIDVHHNSKIQSVLLYVVDVTGPAVIGLPTCERLNIVTINVDHISPSVPISNIDDLTQLYPNQFDTTGSFKGTAMLRLKDDAVPFIDAPRKCPLHIKDELKAEIDKMEGQQVIRKVDEHTDWVFSLAYTTKRDGSLRICLDPQKLNKALRRCPHKIPTLEEQNPMFTNAKVFTKLDAKAGYWAVKLDESSQLLTTFRTPFGRYCWKRLPFGLNISQDIF